MSKTRDLGWYLSNQALQTVAPFLFTPIYTRFIDPDEFGIQYIFSIVLIIGTGLANWGLPYAFERFFFHYEGRRRDELLGTIVSFSSLLLFLFLALVWTFNDSLAALFVDDPHWYPMVTVVFANGVFMHLNSLCLADLKNRQRARSYAVLDLWRFSLFHGLALFAVVLLGWGIWGQVVGSLLSQVGLFCWFVIRRKAARFFHIDWQILSECLGFGWPIMAKTAVTIVQTTVDKYLIGTTATLAALGLYGKAQAWAYMVFALMTTIQNVYTPLWNRCFYNKSAAPVHQSLGPLFSEYCAICAVPSAIMILFAQEIVWLLTPSPYYGAIPLTVLLALNYACMTFSKLQGAAAAYLKITRYVGFTSALYALATIILNIILIPRYGAAGAVFANLFTTVVSTAITALYLRHRIRIGYQLRYLFMLYALLLTAGGLAAASYYFSAAYLLDLSLRSGLFLLILALAARRLSPRRVIDAIKHEIHNLRQRLSPRSAH